jgi:peroxiredoxin
MKTKYQISLVLAVLLMMVAASCKKTTDNPPPDGEKEVGVKVGLYAPDFTLPDKDGNDKTFSDYDGKMVLVDFWASWCHICRGENPELVSLYAEYREKGIEIIGVSIDTDRSSWLNAVQEDGIEFVQVSDLKGIESPVTKLYGVAGVPKMVLTDQDGKILLITTKASEVAAVVKEKLK